MKKAFLKTFKNLKSYEMTLRDDKGNHYHWLIFNHELSIVSLVIPSVKFAKKF